MKELNHYCIACMGDNEGQDVCPQCGSRQDTPQNPPLLPVKTLLSDRYVIGLELNSNAEGISYIGKDTIQDTIVMIREFLPDGLVTRKGGRPEIYVLPEHERTFNRLYTSFLQYNRAVARTREVSAIIPIYDIFEENGTAYTVSELPETITLREFVENNGGQISWPVARPLFMPILSALGAISAMGIKHLAVTPDNLMILTNGKMKLTGFGIPAVRRVGLGLTPELTSGCSALEQYSDEEPVGETTDIYGLCASLFFALTGKLPPDANRRVNNSRLPLPTAVLNQLPQYVVTALANGLQVFQLKRTQSFERLRDELTAAPSVNMNLNPNVNERGRGARSRYGPPVRNTPPPPKKMPSTVYGIISGVVSLIVLAIVGVALLANPGGTGVKGNASDVSGTSSAQTSSTSSENTEGLSSIDAPSGSPIQIPDLTGKTLAQVLADSAFEDYTILAGEKNYSDAVPEGQIFGQTPEPGTSAYPGVVIAVNISNGPTLRKLPKIAGMDVDDARLAIAQAGLECDTISYQPSSSIAPGRVIGYRSPLQEGGEVAAGTFVDLVVSEEKSSSQPSSGA